MTVVIRRPCEHTETGTQEEHHAKREAGTGVMPQWAEDGHRRPKPGDCGLCLLPYYLGLNSVLLQYSVDTGAV